MSKTFNQATVNTAVVQSLRIAASFAAKVSEIRAELPASTLHDVNAVVLALRPGVAKFYGIDHASHGNTGKFVTDDDKVAMAARTALSKLVRAVRGVSVAHTVAPKARVHAEERAAYLALLQACDGDVKRLNAVVKACK